jgi:hypothetical protein
MALIAKTRYWIVTVAIVTGVVIFVSFRGAKTTPLLVDGGVAPISDKGPNSSQPAPTLPPRAPSSEQEKIQKWRNVAKGTHLSVLKHKADGIRVNEAAAAIMGLSDAEVAKLNICLEQFIEALRSEELLRAYVAVKSDGSREIVVPPFERGPLIDRLRGDISETTNSDVAEFISENLRYDTKLAISGTEMRASIVKGEDGADLETFVRTFAVPEQSRGLPVKGPSHLTTTRPLVNGFSFRLRHLFEAMERLPARSEIGTKEGNAEFPKSRN